MSIINKEWILRLKNYEKERYVKSIRCYEVSCGNYKPDFKCKLSGVVLGLNSHACGCFANMGNSDKQ